VQKGIITMGIGNWIPSLVKSDTWRINHIIHMFYT